MQIDMSNGCVVFTTKSIPVKLTSLDLIKIFRIMILIGGKLYNIIHKRFINYVMEVKE